MSEGMSPRVRRIVGAWALIAGSDGDSQVADPAADVVPRDVADSLGVSIPTLYRWVPASSMP